MSDKYKIGTIWNSNKYGKFEIINIGSKKYTSDIKFIDTGFVVESLSNSSVKNGTVVDKIATLNKKKYLYEGKKYNGLTINEVIRQYVDDEAFLVAKCSCDCGNEKDLRLDIVVGGKVKSCGCINFKNLIGERFGKWTIIGVEYEGGKKYKCKCDCGTVKIISPSNITSNKTKSCGCSKTKEYNPKTHLKLHRVWAGMKSRCLTNTHRFYKDYGERGITICEEWNDFKPFVEWAIENGYEEGLTIDRINVDYGYSPENCRWTDWTTQANNKRNNIKVEIRGEFMTIPQIARKYNLNISTVKSRYRNGKRGDELISPVNKI